MSKKEIKEQLEESKNLIEKFIGESINLKYVEDTAKLLAKTLKNGNKIICCANGYSMAELKKFSDHLSIKEYPCITLCDPIILTSLSSIHGFNMVYTKYLNVHAKEGDCLLAIINDNDDNVIKAIERSKIKGMKTVALSSNNFVSNEYLDHRIETIYEGDLNRVREIQTIILNIIYDLTCKILEAN